MRLFFAGTRGSAPVTAPDRAVYGGDTTCLLVTGVGGEQVVLDCGTGLPSLTNRLDTRSDLMVLLTHFHLDHLQGLVTFAPLYAPDTRVLLAAPPADGHTVESAVGGLMQAPYWPITLDQVGSKLSFGDLPSASGETPLRTGGLEIRWAPIPHPGGCTAYRLDEPATGASAVVATDAEWDDAPAHIRADFVRLCTDPAPCAVLVCDGQYDSDAMPQRRGWGHTSRQTAVALAEEVGAGRLLLTHHDPADDDATLAAREREIQIILPTAALARQGQELDLCRKDAP